MPGPVTFPIAVYVILRRGDEVFLVRRANTKFGNGLYTVPAGHLEPGEYLREAAAREAHEEAGVVIAPEDLKLLAMSQEGYVLPEFKSSVIDVFFEATRWEGEPHNAEPHKASEAEWFKESELPSQTLLQVRGAITKGSKVNPAFLEFDLNTNQCVVPKDIE